MKSTDAIQVLDVIESSGLEQSTITTLKERFLPFYEQVETWKERAATLKVTDASQTREMKMAREARLALRAIRVEADKTRKALKEDSIRYGRAVQGVYNVIEYLIKPIEEHLQVQEDFVKIQEAKLREKLNDARAAELAPWADFAGPVSFSGTPYGDMSEDEWSAYIQAAKDAKAAYEKAEAERIAREKAEAEERERIREENERLRAEAEARERQIAEERRKLEEAARKELDEAFAKLKAEQEARAAIEAEARKKAQAEAEEQARKEEEARKLAAGPDKTKLQNFVVKITKLLYSIPETNTAQGGEIAGIAQDALSDLIIELEGYIDAM